MREHNCPECGYKTHRDVAAAQVIRNRGVENVDTERCRNVDAERSRSALGHGVLENACGDGLAGAVMSSQESAKQEILNASLRITVASAR